MVITNYHVIEPVILEQAISSNVIATDPDREGETIAWHLKEALGLKQPKRVVYTEITESAVRSAIAQSFKSPGLRSFAGGDFKLDND